MAVETPTNPSNPDWSGLTVSALLDAAKPYCKAATDADLARCLKVTRQAIANWRAGTALPSWRVAQRLSVASGTPLGPILASISQARAQADKRSPGRRGGARLKPRQTRLPGFDSLSA